MAPAVGTSGDSPPGSKEDARRARKRVTDRNSQRHHRERRRAYIKNLEETVQSYKQGCLLNGNADTAALLSEIETLRAKCRRLESVVERIKDLSSCVDSPTPDAAGLTDPQQSESFQGDSNDNAPTNACSLHDDSTEIVNIETIAGLFPPADSKVRASRHADGERASSFPEDLDLASFLADCADQGLGETSLLGVPANSGLGLVGTNEETPIKKFSSIQHIGSRLFRGPSMSPDLEPASLGSSACPSTGPDGRCHGVHSALPMLSQPKGVWDLIVRDIIQDARLHSSTLRNPSETLSLRSVLVGESTDVLASRLFYHITSFNPIPLHITLASFWVQYLYLRWVATGTCEAYHQIPEFMRPTSLERRIPHQVCIGMLVWPDVRGTLIRDTQSTDPERIGIELLQHLSNKHWSATSQITGDMIGGIDILAIIQHQACQWETWKIDPVFQQRYPQFAHCDFP
ncbi:unnamed protein product [Clonostachys rosea f. rosea IK726]|uniref:BZIP domain-containing protein n=2 Tax=Bionectria ochroleuca TaxID=29856 RepID=A0A0B7K9B3_BIOOC|nr:unnamed protein product [Clonostachys rosea f. rosea IK726]